MTTDGRDLDVSNVLEGVGDSCVLSLRGIVVVDGSWSAFIRVADGVLNDGAESNSVENIRFLIAGKPVAFGVAATFDVENVVISPDVLIVTDKESLGIGGKSGLTSS